MGKSINDKHLQKKKDVLREVSSKLEEHYTMRCHRCGDPRPVYPNLIVAPDVTHGHLAPKAERMQLKVVWHCFH